MQKAERRRANERLFLRRFVAQNTISTLTPSPSCTMDICFGLLELPEELVIAIFRFLDSTTLIALSRVNSSCLQILSNNDTTIWKTLLHRDFPETKKLHINTTRSWKEIYFAYRKVVDAFYHTFPLFLVENWTSQSTNPLNPQISVDPSFVNSCFKVLFYLEEFHSKVDLHTFVRSYYNNIWRLRMGVDTLIRYCCQHELYENALRLIDELQLATEWKRRHSLQPSFLLTSPLFFCSLHVTTPYHTLC
jgi:hypothetical protein